MGMQTDVIAAPLETDDEIDFPARLKGILISYEANAVVTLTDGAANATALFSFTAPTVAGVTNVLLPGEGIRFKTGIYANAVTDATVTVFYG